MDSQLLHGRTADWNVSEELQAARIANADKALRYDPVSSTVSYLGVAVTGSAEGDAVWSIRRITFTAAGSVTVEYADGNNRFDNIWSNRAGLTYS